MKFRIILLFITICLFWTCVHRPGGSLDYELVLKPYPSFILAVGGGEEGSYKRRMLQGEFPSWLVNNNYKAIAYGSFESTTKPWEYLRWFSFAFVFSGWLFVIASAARKTVKALNRTDRGS
jgi:hypothetical protein